MTCEACLPLEETGTAVEPAELQQDTYAGGEDMALGRQSRGKNERYFCQK